MKTFVRSVVGITVIIILGLTVSLFLIWSSIPDMVAANLTRQFKVPVDIGDIDIRYNSIQIDKFIINNPKGSVLTRALSARNIEVLCPLERYFHKKVIIDTVTISDIYLGFEFNSSEGRKGNWTKIMSNYMKSPKSARRSRRTATIKKLVLNNINADVVYRNEGSKVRALPHIDQIILYDVSSNGGLPIHQIMGTVLGQMLEHIFQEDNIENMIKDLFIFPPKGALELIQLPFKALF